MLEVKDISKDFDGLHALVSVSLSVERGSIVGLIGPNGSGKSTLLNIIAGLMPPTSGHVHFDGHDITGHSADEIFRRGLARGYQDPSLFFRMTVLDNLLLPVPGQTGERPWFAPWRWLWKDEEIHNARRAREMLKRVKLEKHYDTLASELSGGQMKLLEIARSVMGNPKMLLLDEPTAGVAPGLAYDIFQQIETLRREDGITFLIVEHRLEMLFDFVDDLYVLHMGQVLAQGPPEAIADNDDVREVYFGE